MSLPILTSYSATGPEALLRLFHRAKLHWARHLGEETVLEVGTAITSAALAHTSAANCLFDAALSAELSPAEAIAQVEAHFAQAAAACGAWVMNPSAPPASVGALSAALLERGFAARQQDVLLLSGAPAGVVRESAGLTIIPARASFRHYRALLEESVEGANADERVEAGMLHLDDPHYDALLALKDGRPVARVGVLAVGETGLIADLFVSAPLRCFGFGRTMMSRALEISARSLFKHVMLSISPENAPAMALCRGLGFQPLGQWVRYVRP